MPGPILFLIYIADIGDSLSTKALVYVDDTKIKQKVNSEEDVECFQKELEKLDEWAKSNNMQFNGKKFQVVRYGQNEELKNNTEYFSGSYEEIIDRFESIRDLGVQLSEDASFNEHIEKVCKKARQKSGWIYRTFYCRSPNFLKQMFKSLVQPHIDYCSQLWMPQEGANMAKIEKGSERFFEKGSWIKKSVLLGKIAINGDEFDAKKTGKISNNLHLENNGGFCAKLWIALVKH